MFPKYTRWAFHIFEVITTPQVCLVRCSLRLVLHAEGRDKLQVKVNFTVIISRGHLAHSTPITKMLACPSHSLVLRVQCVHDHPEEVSFFGLLGSGPTRIIHSSDQEWTTSSSLRYQPGVPGQIKSVGWWSYKLHRSPHSHKSVLCCLVMIPRSTFAARRSARIGIPHT